MNIHSNSDLWNIYECLFWRYQLLFFQITINYFYPVNNLSVNISENFDVSELKSERVFVMLYCNFFVYQENFFDIVIFNDKNYSRLSYSE